MKIAQVAPLWESVPPAGYGGTERIVSYLTEELVRRGHDVTLFASRDSRTSAKLVPIVERALRLADGSPESGTAHHLRMLGQVFAHASRFDLIHCHVDYSALPFSWLVRTPTVHTIHGRLDLPHLQAVYTDFMDVPLVSISHAQRAPLASVQPCWIATVHHGIPLRGIRYATTPGEYLAFLGRMSPEKRPDLAIDVAIRAGVPLRIAAKIDHADRSYFESVITPRLSHPLVSFEGELGGADVLAFLREARALLFPIDWPEPFGLVMLEAMACGTPVIGRPCGSVPEVVVQGRTGFVADTAEALVTAVRQIDSIDRSECRRHVENHFSVERMVDDYETVYRRLLTRAAAA